MSSAFTIRLLSYCIVLAGTFSSWLSCSQFEHASPQPGVLEVRLRVANSRIELIPFSNENVFRINLGKLEAKQPGDVRLEIFSNVNAIRRNPLGDWYNCIDTLARDSAHILGQGFAPPQSFTGLEFTVTPDPILIVSHGTYSNSIPVALPRLHQPLQRLPAAGQTPLNIEVREGRVTRVTITFDLDSALVRRAESFEYRPYYYVSSVQNL